MNVSEIMTREVITIEVDEHLRKARHLFAQHGFHHLPVVEGRKLVGVISDRDLLRSVSPFISKLSERTQDMATLNRRVHQIMTRKLVTVSREATVEDAAQVMLENHVSCLPVVTEDRRAAGIVTWRDLMRALCDPARK